MLPTKSWRASSAWGNALARWLPLSELTIKFGGCWGCAMPDAAPCIPNRCACSAGVLSVLAGRPFGVYAYMTLPADADTVTITVKGLAPFANVKVTP